MNLKPNDKVMLTCLYVQLIYQNTNINELMVNPNKGMFDRKKIRNLSSILLTKA
tara:strand:+ start:3815 stop:3976 length:162 start_codon:yes stop_codon:yes gene_type:complete